MGLVLATLIPATAQAPGRRGRRVRVTPATDVRWAVVENGAIVNVIAWDGVRPYQPEPGQQLVRVTPGTGKAFIGGDYDGQRFTRR